jgi:HlyD family secretion protein
MFDGLRVVPASRARSRRVFVSVLAATLAGLPIVAMFARSWRAPPELVTVTVKRRDLVVEVVAAGQVESSENGEIRCTLERVGQGGGGGASTIIELIPDGSNVKEGDVLCLLDASAYNDLVVRQEIVVGQAQASLDQAALTLEVAKIGSEAYHRGEKIQTQMQYDGQIALAESDLSRQIDRLAWTRRMVSRGYLAANQLLTDEMSLRRLVQGLALTRTSFANFERFTLPKDLISLEYQLEGAETALAFQENRLRQERERLSRYKSMVDRCTVRAPHDGFVLHANRSGRAPEIYLGAPVRQRMPLFLLPDLTRLQVAVLLHETVVRRVRPGMPARIRVEGLGGREVDGRVVMISPMPFVDEKSQTGGGVTNFLGRVSLATLPAGLHPGMSAEVTIETAVRPGALVVPLTAVAIEDGQPVCYVCREGRIDRRPIRVGRSSCTWHEVEEGLAEGEAVVDSASPPPDRAVGRPPGL